MSFKIDPTIVDLLRILRSFSDPGSPKKNTKYKYQDHILLLGSMYSSFLYLCGPASAIGHISHGKCLNSHEANNCGKPLFVC